MNEFPEHKLPNYPPELLAIISLIVFFAFLCGAGEAITAHLLDYFFGK